MKLDHQPPPEPDEIVVRVVSVGNAVRLTFVGEQLKIGANMTPRESAALRELLREAELDASRPSARVRPRTEVEQIFGDRLLTPAEVAELWKVDVTTIKRWAKTGAIPSLTMPAGNHSHRFSENAIRQHMRSMSTGGGSRGN